MIRSGWALAKSLGRASKYFGMFSLTEGRLKMLGVRSARMDPISESRSSREWSRTITTTPDCSGADRISRATVSADSRRVAQDTVRSPSAFETKWTAGESPKAAHLARISPARIRAGFILWLSSGRYVLGQGVRSGQPPE